MHDNINQSDAKMSSVGVWHEGKPVPAMLIAALTFFVNSVVLKSINECSLDKKYCNFFNDEINSNPSSLCWFKMKAVKKANVSQCLLM